MLQPGALLPYRKCPPAVWIGIVCPKSETKRMANPPAYLHYGVNTDEGVLMRKNNIPRSIANRLGELYSISIGGEIFTQPSNAVSNWSVNKILRHGTALVRLYQGFQVMIIERCG